MRNTCRAVQVKQTYATGELGLPSEFFFFFLKKLAVEKEQSSLAIWHRDANRVQKAVAMLQFKDKG